MKKPHWQDSYLRLHPKAGLKNLETCYVYHAGKDELFEIDQAAFKFLGMCSGTRRGAELTGDSEFVNYCLEEEILQALDRPEKISTDPASGSTPSLRYLELHLLHRCNLKCRHCYLGPAKNTVLPLEDAVSIARQFSENGGLRLLISGGEPLMYKNLEAFLDKTRGLGIRRVLFTNGTLLTEKNAEAFDAEEISFSMDGWKHGHEALRGRGTFDKLTEGVKAAEKAKKDISFSTMIHRENLEEFENMEKFIRQTGAVEWGVDILTLAGELSANTELCVPLHQAVPFMQYAFGGGYHGSSDGYACGRHLMAVMPDGQAVKCGFYSDSPLGDAKSDLAGCWSRMPHIRLDELECRDCGFLHECRGGCRFRAPAPLAPDPVMCSLYGVDHGKTEK